MIHTLESGIGSLEELNKLVKMYIEYVKPIILVFYNFTRAIKKLLINKKLKVPWFPSFRSYTSKNLLMRRKI